MDLECSSTQVAIAMRGSGSGIVNMVREHWFYQLVDRLTKEVGGKGKSKVWGKRLIRMALSIQDHTIMESKRAMDCTNGLGTLHTKECGLTTKSMVW